MYAMLSFKVIKANSALKRVIALRDTSTTAQLAIIAVGLFLSATITTFVIFDDMKVWLSFALLSPNRILSFWQALFRSALVDVILRQIGLCIKANYLLLQRPQPGRMFRRQGNILTFIEYATILYASLLPIPIWYRYFHDAEIGQMLSSITTGMYFTLKISTVFERACRCFASLKVVVQPVVQYGQRATKEDIMEVGDVCAICQESMESPLKLRCRHMFCEECISEWLERDTTCPLCRAVVKSETLRSFSDGSSGWLIQLF